MKTNHFSSIVCSALVLCSITVFAQDRNASKVVVATGAKDITQRESISDAAIDTSKIYKVEQLKLQHFELPEVQLTSIQTEKINNPQFPKDFKFPIKFEASVRIGMDRKQAIAYVIIPQYIQKPDGSIERLTKYAINLKETSITSNKTTGSRVYASNSILASGNFYKLAVYSQGVYKIDYNYIKNTLGVDPATFSPANIRLYGNGGELLAENNGIARADDLTENAIQVIDGGDGQFNNGDYILFYANGPHSILKDSINKGFTHTFNIYSEYSAYFLNFDLGVGKRIQTLTTPSTSNVNVTSFNEFVYYEKDSSNLGHFGKTWWADEFSDQPGRYLNRNYSFTIPNMDLSVPVTIRSHFGAMSNSGSSLMNIKANGATVINEVLNAIGTTYNDPVIRDIDRKATQLLTSSTIDLSFQFTKGSSSASGFLDFIELNARRNLLFNGYLNIADWNSVANGNNAQYQIQNANATTQVWDVTNPLQVGKLNSTLTGSILSFIQEASQLHRFVVLDGSVVLTPTFIEKTANQNLHHTSDIDYIIVTPASLKREAERLAAHHAAKRGYRALIVSPQEIYNEFSSGTQDVCAIRDFVKMYYDKSIGETMPKYLLLMGDASYDYKNRIANNTNIVPTFETAESNNKIYGYCTDDFFGFLDDTEDLNNFSNSSQINTLDIGIGRFPVSSASSADDIINKIVMYDSSASFGPWKNNMTFNADDEDNGGHLYDGEAMSGYSNDSLPNYNNYKIYVDGYVQQSTPAGPRTPDANKAVNEQLFNGTFLMNYNGHGGPLGWCEERIFSMDDINGLANIKHLPLFITATCDFAPFDEPSINSAGEILITKPNGGAIALMTTTRLVYQDQNHLMNLNYMEAGFQPMSNGNMPTLGDAYRISKNLRYITHIDDFAAANFRKFALLGDPALPLAFPKYNVSSDSINGVSVMVAYDTLKALGKYTISGHVSDASGSMLSNFNGIVYPTIFDKPKKLSTLQNDPTSPKIDYYVQNNAIYKGKATVINGKFSFTFVVPKDINYEIANGKISYYAANEVVDAAGHDTKIYIGGSSANGIADNQGPIIKAFMNDEKFVNGGITNSSATLLLKLSDDNGINYTGNSIGHDITAVLDGNSQNTYVLNNFFEANINDYKSGTVKFPLNNLTEGSHTLDIKAWDIANNSSSAKLDFVVVNSTKAELSHVYNYPNPFTTHTNFMFEHNMPNQNLYVNISIFSVSGKMVKRIHTLVNNEGNRCDNIEWDGLDEYGERIGTGVYIYKLSVKSQNGFSDSKMQKLIIL